MSSAKRSSVRRKRARASEGDVDPREADTVETQQIQEAAAEEKEDQQQEDNTGEAEDAAAAPDMVGDVGFRRKQTSAVMTNRQKCLVLGSRSMTSKDRHLLLDLGGLMPHARPHGKLDTRQDIGDNLTEICHLHRCNSLVFIESRKRQTAYLWLAQAPEGPSIKLQLLNVHTADELRMVGNCLKYSRPLLHFDSEFDNVPHLRIAKSLLQMVFNTPRYHPKSKPFVDHIMSLFYLDGKIWFRNYQIQDGKEISLTEIGPRFVMEPLAILDGCCKGQVLWRSPAHKAPTEKRKERKQRALEKIQNNERLAKLSEKHKKMNPAPAPGPLDDVFKVE